MAKQFARQGSCTVLKLNRLPVLAPLPLGLQEAKESSPVQLDWLPPRLPQEWRRQSVRLPLHSTLGQHRALRLEPLAVLVPPGLRVPQALHLPRTRQPGPRQHP